MVLCFSFVHLKPIKDFILEFVKISVTEFRVIINECYKISSTSSGENSIRVAHITMNKFEGFKCPCDRRKIFGLILNTDFTSRICVKRRLRNEIQVNHFLDGFEVDKSQSPMSNITRLNAQSNRNRNFIIRKIDYTEPKKAITNKDLSNENIRLEDYKLIGLFDNPIANSKKR